MKRTVLLSLILSFHPSTAHAWPTIINLDHSITLGCMTPGSLRNASQEIYTDWNGNVVTDGMDDPCSVVAAGDTGWIEYDSRRLGIDPISYEADEVDESLLDPNDCSRGIDESNQEACDL